MGMVVAARLTGLRGEERGRKEATMSAGKVDEDRRKQIESDCVSEAWKIGAKSAATALGLAGAAVGGANYFFHGFRTSLGVSGKAALVVSPAFAMFWLYSELALHECSQKKQFELLEESRKT
ncbi:hypothetical protein ABBQ38_007647 [Trebouxia sp. C0009 RCD-2024]